MTVRNPDEMLISRKSSLYLEYSVLNVRKNAVASHVNEKR